MVLDAPGRPLRLVERDVPEPGPGELLLEVRACGVCRTDLHLLDGELAFAGPRVLGHQIVGVVAGEDRRVGVPWLGWTCGECAFCASGRENLCDARPLHRPRHRRRLRRARGRRRGLLLADPRRLPRPAGRAAAVRGPDRLPRAADVRRRAAARPLRVRRRRAPRSARSRVWEGRRVCAFTRTGDEAAQALARELGAEWAGPSDGAPPEPLDAALIFAPAGALVPVALRALAPGGTVVCARHPHERHPVVPLRAALGGAHRALRRQPHPRGRPRVPGARAAGARAHARDGVRARRCRATRSRTCAPAASPAPPSSSPSTARGPSRPRTPG